MNQVAIAISIILSFFSSEFLGLLSGGMISGGYLAVYMQSPFRLVSTLICAIVVFTIVRLLEKIVIIYGRRRFMACVLIGFALTFFWGKFLPFLDFEKDLRIVGFIVPGLIANDMIKQGIVKTFLALTFVTLASKLLLMLTMILF